MRLPRVINTLAVFLFVIICPHFYIIIEKILRVLSNLSLYTKKADKGLSCPRCSSTFYKTLDITSRFSQYLSTIRKKKIVK